VEQILKLRDGKEVDRGVDGACYGASTKIRAFSIDEAPFTIFTLQP
jgi:hypothetical protein